MTAYLLPPFFDLYNRKLHKGILRERVQSEFGKLSHKKFFLKKEIMVLALPGTLTHRIVVSESVRLIGNRTAELHRKFQKRLASMYNFAM